MIAAMRSFHCFILWHYVAYLSPLNGASEMKNGNKSKTNRKLRTQSVAGKQKSKRETA